MFYVLMYCFCSTLVPVRLVGHPDGNHGRVEVLYRGQWGSVCATNFDEKDARYLPILNNK